MVTVQSTVDTGHEDMIHDAQMDFYGTRLATCSRCCSCCNYARFYFSPPAIGRWGFLMWKTEPRAWQPAWLGMRGQSGRSLGLIPGEPSTSKITKIRPSVIKFSTDLETFWPPAPMTEESWYGRRIRASGQRWSCWMNNHHIAKSAGSGVLKSKYINSTTPWLLNWLPIIAKWNVAQCSLAYLHCLELFLVDMYIKLRILLRSMNTRTTIAVWIASSGLLTTLAWWVELGFHLLQPSGALF